MLLSFRNERQKAAVVFIHGFLGDPARSWGEFPQLLITDPRAKEWDCFSFGYKSFRKQIHVVADDFYRSLTSPPLAQYERLALVAHSTGGLATQIALLEHDDLAKRVAYVFFFALPSRGMLPRPKML